MIKVNLLKTKVQTSTHTAQEEETQDYTGFDNFDDGPIVDQQDAAVKLIVIALMVLAVFAYEKYNIGNLEDRFRLLQRQATTKQAEFESLKGNIGNSQEIEKEINEIKEKIDIMNDLSKKRLRELKALDFLQAFIPDGVWMTRFDYNGNKVEIEGKSVSEKDLEAFVIGLEKSQYFLNVVQVSSITKSTKDTEIRDFKLTSELGD